MFLVTGLPRSRTAWFAALFNAVGRETVHDWAATFGTWSQFRRWYIGDRGWCDPCAACAHPGLTLDLVRGHPVAVIARDPKQSAASLDVAQPGDEQFFGVIQTNYERFAREARALVVDYDSLDNYMGVARVVVHCTGLMPSQELFRTFNLLKIEQHTAKAKAAAPTGDVWQ